jgi:hypothetical protein
LLLLHLHGCCWLWETAIVRYSFQTATGEAPTGKLRKVSAIVQDDTSFTFRHDASTTYVGLDIRQLLNSMGSSNSSSSSSSSKGSDNSQPPATDSLQRTSLRQLLQHVQQRTWHDSSEAIDVALRAMAVHIALQAHGYQFAGLPEEGVAVELSSACYTTLYVDAGAQLAPSMALLLEWFCCSCISA